MFHHFFNDKHPKGQGAISAEELNNMIDWLSERYNLIDADVYQNRVENKCLLPSDICLSFDDALLCQYEIAKPVLSEKNLRAFFFVYSAPLIGKPSYLEIFRYFRTVEYKSIDSFYDSFFAVVERQHPSDFEMAQANYNSQDYLINFPFYTQNDRWFRYLRDVTLGEIQYQNIMITLMQDRKFEVNQVISQLWMNDECLVNLRSDGHIIGLHSFSHPTIIHSLDIKEQEEEYRKNFEHLYTVLNENITVMSHPCGNYNSGTLEILRRMGIKVGFRSNSSITRIKSSLEVPREDHSNVLKEMLL